MARKIRTDVPENTPAEAAAAWEMLTESLYNNGRVYVVSRKTDGSISTREGKVMGILETGRGPRARLQHSEGWSTIDPAYAVVERLT